MVREGGSKQRVAKPLVNRSRDKYFSYSYFRNAHSMQHPKWTIQRSSLGPPFEKGVVSYLCNSTTRGCHNTGLSASVKTCDRIDNRTVRRFGQVSATYKKHIKINIAYLDLFLVKGCLHFYMGNRDFYNGNQDIYKLDN